MAESAAFRSTPPPAALPAPNPPAVREQWEVEFSRFFVFQWRHSPTVDAAFRPIAKGTVRYGSGTWLTASSPAIILIVKANSSDVAVLSVSVSGYIHEEHFVSSLQLTWPQVACVPQCPIRGSRVVFISYRDCFNQIQKFVLRFLTCADAETFVYFFKDCSRDTMDFANQASDFLCDSSSPSEMIASNALRYKFNEGESYKEAITRDMPSPAFAKDESYRPSPLLVNSINTTFSGLPPSFTELLTNCSKNSENEISMQLEEANHTLRNGESVTHLSPQKVSEQHLVLDADIKNEIARYMSDASFHDVSERNCGIKNEIAVLSGHLVLDEDIKNEIARYMSDASFHDLLFKIEEVVHELGGDMSL